MCPLPNRESAEIEVSSSFRPSVREGRSTTGVGEQGSGNNLLEERRTKDPVSCHPRICTPNQQEEEGDKSTQQIHGSMSTQADTTPLSRVQQVPDHRTVTPTHHNTHITARGGDRPLYPLYKDLQMALQRFLKGKKHGISPSWTPNILGIPQLAIQFVDLTLVCQCLWSRRSHIEDTHKHV